MREKILKIKRIIEEKVICVKAKFQQQVDELVMKCAESSVVTAKEAGLSAIVIAALLVLVGIILVFIFQEEIEDLIRSLFDIIDQRKENIFQNS